MPMLVAGHATFSSHTPQLGMFWAHSTDRPFWDLGAHCASCPPADTLPSTCATILCV